MIIEEMIHFLERVDKNVDDKQWMNIDKWNQAFGEDRKKPLPSQWKNFYSFETLQQALSRITKVSINQSIVSLNLLFHYTSICFRKLITW